MTNQVQPAAGTRALTDAELQDISGGLGIGGWNRVPNNAIAEPAAVVGESAAPPAGA